jgi:hypothetical protein
MIRSSFLVLACALPLAAQVKVEQGSDRITVDIGGKPFTALFVSADTTKPYLHPLRAASGTPVSRFYPMELVEGERRDHIHQRGLWFSHGDVNGYDFWGNDPSQQGPKKGRISLRKVVDLKSGKKSGTIEALFDWTDAKGTALLSEDKKITFYDNPRLRILDFDLTLTALQKVTFGDTKEGTFAIRLAPWLEEPAKGAPATPKRTGKMVDAQGDETEQNVWGKRSPWVDYFGVTPKGEALGVAILDHPSNPRHPTYWHSRSYGLFAANPFGVHDFTRTQGHEGDLSLEPRQVLRFRYRVIIHPGDYRSADIAGLFKQYASTK